MLTLHDSKGRAYTEDEMALILEYINGKIEAQGCEDGLKEWAKDRFNCYGKYKGQIYGNTDWAFARIVWSAALEYERVKGLFHSKDKAEK